jgi:chromosome partitioning protein
VSRYLAFASIRAAEQLERFVLGLGGPVLGYLRDTQTYVQLAARGMTLWDVARSRVARDIAQWQSIIDWINGLPPTPAVLREQAPFNE